MRSVDASDRAANADGAARVASADGAARADGVDDADAVAPLVDAALDLALRATSVLAGAAGVVTRLGRPVAVIAMRPPMVPSRYWPQTRLALTVEQGRRTRASADRVTAQVAGDLVVAVLDGVLARVDLTAIVNQVIDEIDLPEIIRESSGAMASEAVLGMRIRGIEADERVNRVIDRVLLRRRDPNPAAPAAAADGG